MKKISVHLKNIKKEYNMKKLMKEFHITEFEDEGFTINIDDVVLRVYYYKLFDIPSDGCGTVDYDVKSGILDNSHKHKACILVSDKFLDLPNIVQRGILYHEYAHLTLHVMYSDVLGNSATSNVKIRIAHDMVKQSLSQYGYDNDSLHDSEFIWIKGLSSNKPFDIRTSKKRTNLYNWLINEIKKDHVINLLKNKSVSIKSMSWLNIYKDNALKVIESHLSPTELEADISATNKIGLSYINSLKLSNKFMMKYAYSDFMKSMSLDNILLKIMCEVDIQRYDRYNEQQKNNLITIISKNRHKIKINWMYYKYLINVHIRGIMYALSIGEEIKIRIRLIKKRYLIDKIMPSSIKC